MNIKRYLNLSWAEQSWEVDIRRRKSPGCRLDREILRLVRSRFESLALGEMRRSSRPRPRGFTLIELLVVIAIIAILAGIILPVLATMKTRGKVASARAEMMNLVTAIKAYESEYNRYPASPAVETLAATTGDYTYLGANWSANAGDPTNSQVMVILMDIDHPPNDNHRRNPRKSAFFNARQSSGDFGFSTVDHVLRDPFGSPYVITMDMNDDNKVVDSIYGLPSVSERSAGDNAGHVGLMRNPAGKFELNGPVMIWSFGPDKQFDKAVKAKEGFNRDNILSWSN